MNRREAIALVGGAAAWPISARAQQAAMPVIGVMSPQSLATASRNLAAFRSGLRQLGYAEGRNVHIEYRFAEGVPERYPAHLADLIALNPAVITVGSIGAVLAARKLTQTIPLIMFLAADDPVALGLVDSFARPGGNLTGFLTSSNASIIGKRLELLLEAAPGLSRIGVLLNRADATADGTLGALPSAARALRLDVRVYEATSEAGLEIAFSAALRDGVQALYVSQTPLFISRRTKKSSQRSRACGFRPSIFSGSSCNWVA